MFFFFFVKSLNNEKRINSVRFFSLVNGFLGRKSTPIRTLILRQDVFFCRWYFGWNEIRWKLISLKIAKITFRDVLHRIRVVFIFFRFSELNLIVSSFYFVYQKTIIIYHTWISNFSKIYKTELFKSVRLLLYCIYYAVCTIRLILNLHKPISDKIPDKFWTISISFSAVFLT